MPQKKLAILIVTENIHAVQAAGYYMVQTPGNENARFSRHSDNIY
jgi:hypothetical protein